MTRNEAFRRIRTGLLVPLAAFALAGCSNLLDVEFPGRIPADQVNDPTLATVLANSVVGDLECAYNNYTAASSIHSDEYESSNSNVPGANWGERSITADEDDYVGTNDPPSPCEGTFLHLGLHVPMQTARFQAEDIFTKLNGWTDAQVPNRAALLAQVRTYGGFPYLFFGETYCAIAFDGGASQTPAQSLAIAEARFTEAIGLAQAAGTPDLLDLARVGLARTEMNLKKWAEAASAAAQVTPGFEAFATRGTENERRWNKLFKNATDLGLYVIGCTFRSAPTPVPAPDPCAGVPTIQDPRLLVKDANKKAFNPFTELWVNTKYNALQDPIRLASYKEAQLILAEAQAQQGDFAAAQQTINTYRAGYSLPPLTFASQTDAVTQIIEERRMELSFEGGHRLNDLLRYDLPWKGAQGSNQNFNPFSARPYGTLTCWPLPTKEIAGA
jgi:hypothetical protein